MRVGVHLPQYGRAAGPVAIQRAARHAEQLGFADLWVSDHVVHPAAQDYPSPYLYDPLLTLAWAGAVTQHVGLGTSVLVAAQHNPVWLANALASLDALSAGRLTVAVGVGWSEAEFRALGQSFSDRGRRTDEIINLLRALPKPAHAIALWIGGSSEAAYTRAVRAGQGFQLLGLDPDQVVAPIARLRRDLPDPAFTISLRTGWDPQGMDTDRILREHEAYAAAGVQHMVSAPWRNDLDAWLRSMELLADLLGLQPRS
jgi:alkanesulfonate monooxygenase SsuD/methylene tetrahydromethanopterin reductase-like flavin-dependent oxidoreductase (luciferase family)